MTLIVTLSVFVLILFGVAIYQYFKFYKLHEKVTQTEFENISLASNINLLFKTIETESAEKEKWKDRAESVEKAFKTGFGVTARNEITLVNTELLKVEWVVMLAGVEKLLRTAKSLTTEDAQIYIDLIKKISEILDKMPESQETKKVSELI